MFGWLKTAFLLKMFLGAAISASTGSTRSWLGLDVRFSRQADLTVTSSRCWMAWSLWGLFWNVKFWTVDTPHSMSFSGTAWTLLFGLVLGVAPRGRWIGTYVGVAIKIRRVSVCEKEPTAATVWHPGNSDLGPAIVGRAEDAILSCQTPISKVGLARFGGACGTGFQTPTTTC